MTTKRKKSQTPEEVLDLIATQSREIDKLRLESKRYMDLWTERGVVLARAYQDRDYHANTVKTLLNKVDDLQKQLKEAQEAHGKTLADAKRARDEAKHESVFVVLARTAAGATWVEGRAYTTKEAAINAIKCWCSYEKMIELNEYLYQKLSAKTGEFLTEFYIIERTIVC